MQAAFQHGKFPTEKIPVTGRGGGTAHCKHYSEELLYRRFFAALILTDLVTELPLQEIVCKYGVGRGPVQSLQTTSASFWYAVLCFSQCL